MERDYDTKKIEHLDQIVIVKVNPLEKAIYDIFYGRPFHGRIDKASTWDITKYLFDPYVDHDATRVLENVVEAALDNLVSLGLIVSESDNNNVVWYQVHNQT